MKRRVGLSRSASLGTQGSNKSSLAATARNESEFVPPAPVVKHAREYPDQEAKAPTLASPPGIVAQNKKKQKTSSAALLPLSPITLQAPPPTPVTPEQAHTALTLSKTHGGETPPVSTLEDVAAKKHRAEVLTAAVALWEEKAREVGFVFPSCMAWVALEAIK